ncbi:TolC family protein [Mariniblastus fucicola]|uniref:Outer membrane efflux protein n=1 Tax=Mariniblastus fucicola TaxID=980251 RepID=A0A5B9PFJ9_9BACT|nr:TolC family protein [Mariniblastus fucicola]QEG25064.1 Outer membrane efflux protein [Mariniblastus fucicola]
MSQTHTQTTPGSGCARRNRAIALAILFSICSAQLVMIAGCHRGFYRRQADAEARRLVTEKLGSRWNSATGDVHIDPMSRMFDPFSADHPPIPPDDPAAHKLMHTVDGKPGYPHWHANGDIEEVENPTWRQYLPVNEKGQVVLSLSDAYRMALIHSPDLQQQRETLYLSALEVSIQRFGFDSQLFSGFNSFLTGRGRFQTGTGSSSTTVENSLGVNGGGLSARRLGITGANFVVGLANTILWEFSGNNTTSANSLINFSVIQPLLRGAGRERIMESLTQAERTLLANVRQLERFRRGFYLEIATGRDAGAGPSQTTSSFLNQPGLAGSNVGGYLGLLQQKQQIKNLEFSVAQFESLLKQFRELFERDRIDSLQVAQFESSVYGQQESLLNSRITYKDSLDRFKVLIGLPPDVDVVIEDPFLDGFKLIDDTFPERIEAVKALRDEISDSVVEFGSTVRQLYRDARLQEEGGEDVDIENQNLDRQLKALLPYMMQARQLVASIKDEDRKRVAEDIKRLGEVRSERLSYLESVKDDIEAGRLESQVETLVFTEESVPTSQILEYQLENENNERSLIAKLDGIIAEIDERIARIKNGDQSGLSGSEFYEKLERDFAKRIPDLLTEVDGIVLEMALLQSTARTNSIEITNVDIDSDQAFETARCLRRDWMNARGSLVDRWRQIEFFADQLEAQVDLVLTGEIGNAGADNPFRIRYEDGNLRAGFRFDAPIVRQSERNAYRQAQISYQQARRSYYRFEDAISQSLRQTIRNINQDKLLFELNRQNIQVNIKAVQLARARLVQPPAPGQDSTLSDVTARNLTGAIQGLTSAQNRYLGLWTEYEVLRRSLDFDMGTMELDPMFEWVDPGEIDETIGLRVAAREGVAENERFCCGLQQAQTYVEEFYEGEVVESETVMSPPGGDDSNSNVNSMNSIEYDANPIQPVAPREPVASQTFEAPVVEPAMELSPLGKSDVRTKASKPVTARANAKPTSGFQTVLEDDQVSVSDFDVSNFPPIQSKPTIQASTVNSTRTGYLDPFQRGNAGPSEKLRLIGSPITASTDAGSATGVSGIGTVGLVSPNSSLERAFQLKVEEPKEPVRQAIKAEASILTR